MVEGRLLGGLLPSFIISVSARVKIEQGPFFSRYRFGASLGDFTYIPGHVSTVSYYPGQLDTSFGRDTSVGRFVTSQFGRV